MKNALLVGFLFAFFVFLSLSFFQTNNSTPSFLEFHGYELNVTITTRGITVTPLAKLAFYGI
jgi:hypothetical protein